jgi:predicted RNase H-like nuclease (RuvC/YqgF family)
MEINAFKNENILREHVQRFFEPFTKECQQFDGKCTKLGDKIQTLSKRLDECDYLAYKQRQTIKEFEEQENRIKKLVSDLVGVAQSHV